MKFFFQIFNQDSGLDNLTSHVLCPLAGAYLDDLWSFNPSTRTWTQHSTGPAARNVHSVVWASAHSTSSVVWTQSFGNMTPLEIRRLSSPVQALCVRTMQLCGIL